MQRRALLTTSIALLGVIAGCGANTRSEVGSHRSEQQPAGTEGPSSASSPMTTTETDPSEDSFLRAQLVNSVDPDAQVFDFDSETVQSLEPIQIAVEEAISSEDGFGNAGIDSKEEYERLLDVEYVQYQNNTIRTTVMSLD